MPGMAAYAYPAPQHQYQLSTTVGFSNKGVCHVVYQPLPRTNIRLKEIKALIIKLKLPTMNKVFDGASVAGIVNPGDIYIFCDDQERGSAPGPLEYLYIIRDEKEILRALDM